MNETQPLPTNVAMVPCDFCGMPCTPNEYHPYAACLMFKACHDSDTVRANLDAVRAQPAPAPTADALRTARAYVKWHAFGECRADGWTGRPPDAAETVELLDAAIAAQQGDTK